MSQEVVMPQVMIKQAVQNEILQGLLLWHLHVLYVSVISIRQNSVCQQLAGTFK